MSIYTFTILNFNWVKYQTAFSVGSVSPISIASFRAANRRFAFLLCKTLLFGRLARAKGKICMYVILLYLIKFGVFHFAQPPPPPPTYLGMKPQIILFRILHHAARLRSLLFSAARLCILHRINNSGMKLRMNYSHADVRHTVNAL